MCMCVQTHLSWCASFGMLFTMPMHAEYLLKAPTISILVLILERTCTSKEETKDSKGQQAVLSVHDNNMDFQQYM